MVSSTLELEVALGIIFLGGNHGPDATVSRNRTRAFYICHAVPIGATATVATSIEPPKRTPNLASPPQASVANVRCVCQPPAAVSVALEVARAAPLPSAISS